MAPNTVVSLILVLQVLLAGQIHSSHGKSLRTISVEEYHNLEKSTSGSFVVVYFDSSGNLSYAYPKQSIAVFCCSQHPVENRW